MTGADQWTSLGDFLDKADVCDVIDLMIARQRKRLDDLLKLREMYAQRVAVDRSALPLAGLASPSSNGHHSAAIGAGTVSPATATAAPPTPRSTRSRSLKPDGAHAQILLYLNEHGPQRSLDVIDALGFSTSAVFHSAFRNRGTVRVNAANGTYELTDFGREVAAELIRSNETTT